jgi:Type II CAAX prenyl endopeptidase Rce1-like
MLVNLHERAWANQGKERVVFESDVPAKAVPQVQLLQKTDGNLPPAFKHARDQVRPRKFHTLTELNRKHDRLSRQIEIRPNPLSASVILGIVWAAWHIDVFFSPFTALSLFTASAIALSILMTLLFLHTRGSILLAIVMHGSGMPGKEIAKICFSVHEPPDWLRAVVVIR